MTEVSIVKGDVPYDLASKTFDLIHVDELIQKGDTVLIKPNLADVRRNLPRRGDQTSREAIEAVVRAVRENTEAGQVIIAEGSATPTWESFLQWRLLELAEKYRVRLIDLNNDEAYKVWVKNGSVLKRIWTPRTIQRADVVISLPVLKVWSALAVSMNIKNIAGGCLPRFYYGMGLPCGLAELMRKRNPVFNPEEMYGQRKTLSAVCVDVCLATPVHIAVIDALTVMHMVTPLRQFTFTPDSVQVDELNLFIGGTDMVAVDAVGSAVMGFNPEKIVHLNMAAEKGLGTNRLEDITIIGKPIEEVRRNCNPIFGMQEILQS